MAKNNNFEKELKEFFKKLKDKTPPLILNINDEKGNIVGYLEFVNKKTTYNNKVIKLLADWRRRHSWYFPSQFTVTIPGTKIWAQKALIDKVDRILFLVKDRKGIALGHMGLYSFDFKEKSCEIDNVVRGRKSVPGMMTYALKTLIDWTFKNIEINELYLKVFKDNEKAIALYKRCSFVEKKLIPLKKRVDGSTTYWEETTNKNPERYFMKMIYKK